MEKNGEGRKNPMILWKEFFVGFLFSITVFPSIALYGGKFVADSWQSVFAAALLFFIIIGFPVIGLMWETTLDDKAKKHGKVRRIYSWGMTLAYCGCWSWVITLAAIFYYTFMHQLTK